MDKYHQDTGRVRQVLQRDASVLCNRYDTPENYRKRYHKGKLPRKNTFEKRVASPEPKFVRERREKSDNKEDK